MEKGTTTKEKEVKKRCELSKAPIKKNTDGDVDKVGSSDERRAEEGRRGGRRAVEQRERKKRIYESKIREAVEGLKSIVEGLQGREDNILIIGDFNARIGKGQIDSEGNERQ